MADVSDPALDARLSKYLDDAEQNPIGRQLDELRGAVTSVADGLFAHIKECSEHRESQKLKVASMYSRLESLEAGNAKTIAPPPPIRSEADSSHDLHVTADMITAAALEGIKNPHSTPEEEIKKVVDRLDEQKKRDRRFAELEAAEIQREKAAADRRKLVRQLFIAAAGGGVPVAGFIEWAYHTFWPHR
jgi:hypothetical protein